jgi:hypothetical protein
MAYHSISTTTLGSTSSSVTLSSIPSSYTDLFLVITTTTSTLDPSIRLRFNSDASTNYSYQNVIGYSGGAIAQIAGGTNHTRISGQGATDTMNFYTCNVFDYANATTYKTQLSRGVAPGNSSSVDAHVGVWRSSSAINSMEIYPSFGTFSSGSVFALYGIKAA